MSLASSYLTDLRKKVGNDLLLLPAVSVLIINDENELLLVQQADTGLWGTVGGMVEPGETPEEAAQREAYEEVRVNTDVKKICAVVGGPKYEVTYPNGDRVSYVSTVYEVAIVSGEPMADLEEIAAVQWVPVDKLHTFSLHSFSSNLFTDLGFLVRDAA